MPTYRSSAGMKLQVLAGLILAGFGAFIVLRGFTYGSQRTVMRLGDMHASVEERRAVPTWVGGVAIAVGLVLVVGGVRRRRGA